MPRGLITVVLAFEVTQLRGSGLAFVPGLAFAVILITNLLLVLASFRVRRSAPAVAATPLSETSVDRLPVPAVAAPSGPLRRWVLNAVMLLVLALGGVVLWYGNHSEQLQPKAVQWVQKHLHREE
jgi:hypothetical protein